MKKRQIAITIRSFDNNAEYSHELQDLFEIRYINQTGTRLEKSDLIQALTGCEGVIAGTEVFNQDVFSRSPFLKVISRVGVGTDTIDLDYARLHNIRVLNTPHAPVGAVAEHTLALILSILKRIPEYDRNVKKRDMAVRSGEMIDGKTIGIVGLGRIGFQVASLLACFGAKIRFFDPFLAGTTRIPEEWLRTETLETLLSSTDIVTLHATPSGKALLDDRAFSSCKKGIIIINTARESLIDEKALIDAIRVGIVGGIALDVFDKDHVGALTDATPNSILTPHVASNTLQSRREMENEAVLNLIRGLGEIP